MLKEILKIQYKNRNCICFHSNNNYYDFYIVSRRDEIHALIILENIKGGFIV